MTKAHPLPACYLLALLVLGAGPARAQETTVTASVSVVESGKNAKTHDSGDVVLWLTPAENAGVAAANSLPLHRPRLVQKNKSFEPHVLVIPVGSMVEFPNRDPFFHNVFSLFDGKRFDLGLYEAGTTRDVLFDKPGISYIFCNIHAEMSAVVIAVNTAYYAISDRKGQVVIPHVPPGRYMLRFWYGTALPEALNTMTREVTISENSSNLGVLRLPASGLQRTHKNMYGHDYPPPSPVSPVYERP